MYKNLKLYSVIPQIAEIDHKCSSLLQELVNLWVDPPKPSKHFNIDLFREYLINHPNGPIEIHYIENGYPLWLNNRDPSSIDRLHYNLNLLCVPKKNNETQLMTEIRVARHGSFATQRRIAINKVIDKEKCKIPTLPNIRKYIAMLIKYKYVSLRDLKDAFRQILVASEDIGYIQYCIFGLIFADHRQAYGVSSAAANCQHFAQILIWIFENKYLSDNQKDRLLVHIDDFLIAANSEDEANEMAARFDKMCNDLNVQISHEKDENAITEGVVHGIGFNLTSKYVHIPQNKFDEIQYGLQLMIDVRYATGRALESICGKMMHWSQLRKPAKILCYRLLHNIHEHIRSNPKLKNQIFWLSDDIIRDFIFWLRYSSFIRYVSMESVLNQPSITITASTDASDVGGGFIVGSMYGAYKFNDAMNKYGINHRRMHINNKEAHAVLMLIYNYRQTLAGRKLLLYIDNTPTMYSLFKYWSGSQELVEYIQEISLLMSIYCIEVRVEYIPSSFNGMADALSRFEWDRFYNIVETFNLTIDDSPSILEYYHDLSLLRKGSL